MRNYHYQQLKEKGIVVFPNVKHTKIMGTPISQTL